MILDVKSYFEEEKAKLKERIEAEEFFPILGIIQCGNDPASNAFIRNKIKDCNDVGIVPYLVKLGANCEYKTIIRVINNLVYNDYVTGIIVQRPLPEHIVNDKFYMPLNVDVDGFIPTSDFEPCTAKGIIDYLDHLKIDLAGKNVCIINRSNLIGRPLAKLMLNRDATVTICHSKTKCLKDHLSNADIIVSATGIPGLICKNNVNKNQIVIDAGTTYRDGKVFGDVTVNVREKVDMVTPVPGGVGLLTRLALLQNVVMACERRYK